MPKANQPETDRRSRERLVARLPVSVRQPFGSGQVKAHTRDITSNGIFLYSDTRLEEASEVELVLMLPPELTAGEKCWVCCHAQVVRVEEGHGSEFGVAAEIRRMEILPEIPA
jgi:PilZ domain